MATMCTSTMWKANADVVTGNNIKQGKMIMSNETFLGFRRPDGRFGIRNYVLILPTSVCANKVAQDIARQVKGATWVNNDFGCCQVAGDARLTEKTLINVANNPNVGAIVVVGLGCEGAEPLRIAEEITAFGKPTSCITIQEEGGTLKCQARGISLARDYAQQLSMQKPQQAPVSELLLAMECGGSDTTSGLASNPSCGVASDKLIRCGGSSILSETTEFIGAEHVMAKRAVTPEVGQQLIDLVVGCEARAKALGEDIRGGQPTPGNIKGGLTTIEEKSLGCMHKAGHAPLQGVLEYADSPTHPGLWIMDTRGRILNLFPAWWRVERRSLFLLPVAERLPVTNSAGNKITGNKATWEMMQDNIDIDVSAIMSGEASITQMGEEIYQEILRVANGKTTKSEDLGHNEFSIYKIAPTF
ncbi:hydrolase, UxaA family [Salmonella enterica subsp. enterica]|uniref:Hydrolase, UxaA family n=1 Tax=Salmonella enterica I TaxID=59201 RepID=A0A379WXN0_SALET|nr:hydrolase, UxaA family [Salmonella enterica subsp. enterica]